MRPTPEVPGRLRLHDLMQHYCVLKFNSPRRNFLKAVGVTVASASMLGLTGCGSSSGSPASSKTVEVNVPVVIGSYEITIKGLSFEDKRTITAGKSYMAPKSGNCYALVEWSILNITKEDIAYTDMVPILSLEYGDGYKFEGESEPVQTSGSGYLNSTTLPTLADKACAAQAWFQVPIKVRDTNDPIKVIISAKACKAQGDDLECRLR